ncbi:hypothetical protein EDB85DRAFT_1888439 [Lactarius pseudohatsudake]|nr:hypothetical protein EDB85DRAFT_1888439 [Lactarius pseudohatsudake]
MAPKTLPTRHATSTRHSRPRNHRPPRHPNTARKTRRPERKTPPICHSRSHTELPSHMTATTMATNTRPATSWASAKATSPPLPRIFTTRKSTTTTPPHESPAPMPCGRDTQDPPPPATSLRHGPATVNPPPPRPPTPRHPNKARQTTPTHRLTATLTHRHADSPPRRPLNTVRKTTTAPTPPRRGPQHHQPGVDILY